MRIEAHQTTCAELNPAVHGPTSCSTGDLLTRVWVLMLFAVAPLLPGYRGVRIAWLLWSWRSPPAAR